MWKLLGCESRFATSGWNIYVVLELFLVNWRNTSTHSLLTLSKRAAVTQTKMDVSLRKASGMSDTIDRSVDCTSPSELPSQLQPLHYNHSKRHSLRRLSPLHLRRLNQPLLSKTQTLCWALLPARMPYLFVVLVCRCWLHRLLLLPPLLIVLRLVAGTMLAC